MGSEVTTPLPQYRCHKVVGALKIKAVRLTDPLTLEFAEPGFPPIEVGSEWVARHGVGSGGYYVVYEDGYASFSPAKAFEEGYTRIEPEQRYPVRKG